MKIVYWDVTGRQNFPVICRDALIKIRGFNHKGRTFRGQIELIKSFPWHTFLLSVTSPSDFYDIPDNVIPVFHASNDRELKELLPLVQEQPIKVLSLFCHEVIHTHGIKADWFFVSGNDFRNVKTVFNNLNYCHECVYLEYYKGSKILANIPEQFKKRLIPKKVIYKVIENQFSQILSGELVC